MVLARFYTSLIVGRDLLSGAGWMRWIHRSELEQGSLLDGASHWFLQVSFYLGWGVGERNGTHHLLCSLEKSPKDPCSSCTCIRPANKLASYIL